MPQFPIIPPAFPAGPDGKSGGGGCTRKGGQGGAGSSQVAGMSMSTSRGSHSSPVNTWQNYALMT